MLISMIEKWQKKTRRRLLGYGVSYMFPGINEWIFLTLKIIFALIVFGIISKAGIIIGIAASIAGFFIPDILMYISNSADNDAMLPDIESMYDIMKIQARAGVFIQDSLMDCYISTSNKRLKAAILELCNQIGTNKTMEEAVDNFSRKFSNRHIDVLCIVLTQAQSSGKTVQILSDMNEQINQLRHQRAKKDEGKLERKIEILELMIFVGILAIGVLAMGNEIFNMMKF